MLPDRAAGGVVRPGLAAASPDAVRGSASARAAGRRPHRATVAELANYPVTAWRRPILPDRAFGLAPLESVPEARPDGDREAEMMSGASRSPRRATEAGQPVRSARPWCRLTPPDRGTGVVRPGAARACPGGGRGLAVAEMTNGWPGLVAAWAAPGDGGTDRSDRREAARARRRPRPSALSTHRSDRGV